MPVLPTASTRTYTARIADTRDEVRAAQRLRTSVFGGELGADLSAAHPTPGAGHAHPGDRGAIDADAFDELCDHLVVTREPAGEIVGTYRILPPNRSPVPYSATEFDLSDLAPLAGEIVEAGRSCVDPAHRNGSVITLMWSALARYTLLTGHRYLGGCASVPLADGGTAATSAWHLGATRHASPAEYRVRPYRPWLPPRRADDPRHADLPPLLRGYLRLGAWVCGPPAHDPAFDVADFYVLLPLDEVDERYLRYLLGDDR